MTPSQIEKCLDKLVVLVDTREQPTARLKERLDAIGFESERKALLCGDYSARIVANVEESIDLSGLFAIERKMDIDELAMCFTRERERFKREFERARDAGIKMYLIVEECNWEKLYNASYRSKMNPKALVNSILAFEARYDLRVYFCRKASTGKLIRDICRIEARRYLENNFLFEKQGKMEDLNG